MRFISPGKTFSIMKRLERALHLLAVGYWTNKKDIAKNWTIDRVFEPNIDSKTRDEMIRGWNKAVKCSFGWALED